MHMGRQPAQIGDVVVDKSLWAQRLDGVGFRTAVAFAVAGGHHALDRKSQRAQIAQSGRFKRRIERGDTDQRVAGIVQPMAGLDGTRDRRQTGPERLVELSAQVSAQRLVQTVDMPAVHRPVGLRVALRRIDAKRPLPRVGVAQMQVDEHAISVQSK